MILSIGQVVGIAAGLGLIVLYEVYEDRIVEAWLKIWRVNTNTSTGNDTT